MKWRGVHICYFSTEKLSPLLHSASTGGVLPKSPNHQKIQPRHKWLYPSPMRECVHRRFLLHVRDWSIWDPFSLWYEQRTAAPREVGLFDALCVRIWRAGNNPCAFAWPIQPLIMLLDFLIVWRFWQNTAPCTRLIQLKGASHNLLKRTLVWDSKG